MFSVTYGGGSEPAPSTTSTSSSDSGGFDWNRLFDLGAGVVDQAWYSEQEAARDQLAAQVQIAQAQAQAAAQQSTGLGIDQNTMLLIGAGLAAVLLVAVLK